MATTREYNRGDDLVFIIASVRRWHHIAFFEGKYRLLLSQKKADIEQIVIELEERMLYFHRVLYPLIPEYLVAIYLTYLCNHILLEVLVELLCISQGEQALVFNILIDLS